MTTTIHQNVLHVQMAQGISLAALNAHAADHDAHGVLLDADIPAAIARDAEVTAALQAHADLQTVHGLTASYIGAMGAADSPNALNPWLTVSGAANLTAVAGLTKSSGVAGAFNSFDWVMWTVGSPADTRSHLIKIPAETTPGYYIVVNRDIDFAPGEPDRQFSIGWNRTGIAGLCEDTSKPSLAWVIEQYQVTADPADLYHECYVEYSNPGGVGAGGHRTYHSVIQQSTGRITRNYVTGDFDVILNADSTIAVHLGETSSYFTKPVGILGSSDVVQLLVKGNSTQTNYIFQIQDSSGGGLFNFTASGRFAYNALSHPTDQVWAFDYTLQSSASGADVAMLGLRFSVIRDNGGPAFSWTDGINATVLVRGLTADANSRYSYAGHFELAAQANSGRSATISVNANVIESRLTKMGGGGTEAFAAPHGIDIGDMGGTGSYTPAAVYIAAQTTPTSGAPYAIQSISGRVLLGGLPTSDAGLAAGELWRNGTAINIVA
jgi:hypothetical protein